MRNKSSAWVALALMAGLTAPAGAQVVTLGQALKSSSSSQQSTEAQNVVPKRESAQAHLVAIFGRSSGLRAALTLNGTETVAEEGDMVRAGSTACRLTRIDVSARCVSLSQASRAGDLCPIRVCWSGEPLQVDPEVNVGTPLASRDLGMPPVPVPTAPSPKR